MLVAALKVEPELGCPVLLPVKLIILSSSLLIRVWWSHWCSCHGWCSSRLGKISWPQCCCAPAVCLASARCCHPCRLGSCSSAAPAPGERQYVWEMSKVEFERLYVPRTVWDLARQRLARSEGWRPSSGLCPLHVDLWYYTGVKIRYLVTLKKRWVMDWSDLRWPS